MKMLALAGLLAFGGLAHAVVPADHMTCAQAIDTYERHGRIYVIAGGGEIVPIYGMTPIRRWRELHCNGHQETRRNYWVNTRDNDTCVIAVYCG